MRRPVYDLTRNGPLLHATRNGTVIATFDTAADPVWLRAQIAGLARRNHTRTSHR